MKRILLFLILIINRNIFISKVDEPIDINYYSLNNENLEEKKFDELTDTAVLKDNKLTDTEEVLQNDELTDTEEVLQNDELTDTAVLKDDKLTDTAVLKDEIRYINYLLGSICLSMIIGLIINYLNMLTITPVINESLQVLNIKAAEGIEKLKAESIDTSGFVEDNDIKIPLMIDLTFKNIQGQQLKELKPLIKDLYHEMSLCINKQTCKEMIKKNMKHQSEYGNGIYKLIDKYENFYFTYYIDDDYIQINILTKKQNTTNEYNQLLEISYYFINTIYYIEYFIDNNNNIVLRYNNNYLYQIDFRKNKNRIFYLYNPNNKENIWDLKLNEKTIIEKNITLDQEQIKITDSFLKEISNISTITPVINTSLQVLKVKAEEGIGKLQKQEIDTTEFVENNDIKILLITDLTFDIQGQELKEELKELKPLIQYLYHQMSSCHNKEDYEEMIERNMEHQFKDGNGIYKFKEDKYEKFYFQYFIFNSYIQIHILTKKDSVNNEYNKLLEIGGDFGNNPTYDIEYFIEENKSILLIYNNNHLSKIIFKKNDTIIFYLYNPDKNNEENKWELCKYNKNIKDEILQNDITLDKEQIKTTYEFLKEIINIPTITPVINTSLQVLKINAEKGIEKLEERIKELENLQKEGEEEESKATEEKEKIETQQNKRAEKEMLKKELKNLKDALIAIHESGFVSNGEIELKLIKKFEFKNIQDTELIKLKELKPLIKDLYHEMSFCHSKKVFEEMIKKNMEHNYQYGHGIYKLKEDKYTNKYKDFYFTYCIYDHINVMQINILTKKQNTTNKYNQLLNIGYYFSDKSYLIEYFIDEDNNNSIELYYNNNYLYRIDFRKNKNRIFYLYNPDENNGENKWELKLNKHTIIHSEITLDKNQIKITYEFLKNECPSLIDVKKSMEFI